MNLVYPCIYADGNDNIWKFALKDNKELCYKVMYKEGKWTKESIIDTEVFGFALFCGENETIHLVYSNSKSEIKYCTMRNKQWVGKTIYHMDSDEFDIQEIKIEIMGEDMHIFYMLIAKDESDHAVLMHCIWNGRETRINTLQDIVLSSNILDHFKVQVIDENSLNVFFITDEGNEAAMKCCSYEGRQWQAATRLYGIQGDNISFAVLNGNQENHILVRYKEKAHYILDYTSMDINGEVKAFRVYESKDELREPILYSENDRLYTCWIIKDKISCAIFEGDKWSNISIEDSTEKVSLQRYIYYEDENSNNLSSIYGTEEPDLHLYFPSQFIRTEYDSFVSSVKQRNSISTQDLEKLVSISEELKQLKLENKYLENRAASLKMQLQKKQRLIDELEASITKASEQKKKVEENCKAFQEVQQDTQKKLESSNLKVEEIKKEISNLQKQLAYEKNMTIMDRLLKRKLNDANL